VGGKKIKRHEKMKRQIWCTRALHENANFQPSGRVRWPGQWPSSVAPVPCSVSDSANRRPSSSTIHGRGARRRRSVGRPAESETEHVTGATLNGH